MAQLLNKIFTKSSSVPAFDERKALVTDFFGKTLDIKQEPEYEYIYSLVQKGTVNIITGDYTVESTESTWRLTSGDESMSEFNTDIENLVNKILDQFRQIPNVNNATSKQDGKMVVFNIFVNMPKYNDELMNALIDVEIDSIKQGLAQNYTFDFSYIPITTAVQE